MKLPESPHERRDALIAASVTFVVALLLLLLLFLIPLSRGDRGALAQASIPETQDVEEIYLEPSLMELEMAPHGDENAEDIDETAPQAPGEPDLAEEENLVLEVTADEPVEQPRQSDTPAKTEQNPEVTTQNTSPVAPTKPSIPGQHDSRLTTTGDNFKSDNNGSKSGTSASASGSGGNGSSAKGHVNGREFKGCDKITDWTGVAATVRVDIVVDAAGNTTGVTDIQTINGTASSSQKEACRKMAYSAKWDAASSKDAPDVTGYILFKLTPKN